MPRHVFSAIFCVVVMLSGASSRTHAASSDVVLERLERLEHENRALRARLERVEHGQSSGRAAAPAAEVERVKAEPVATVPLVSSGKSAYDGHLRRTAGDAVPSRTRVFGHVAVNAWEGERNVVARGGRNGTTNVYDAAFGIDSRLSTDMDLRFRGFTILPPIGGEGDGFGNNRDFVYMRDVYLTVKNIFGEDAVNLRFGRVPYAFGDEYLQFDAPLNPLVSHSAAFFWGFDEGIHIFGNITKELSYIAQLRLDGETGNGSDDTRSKAAGIKVMGDHGRHWHWSLSYFDSGRARGQELWIGRTVVGRLGATGAPGGASTSADVAGDWGEANVKYSYDRGYVSGAIGTGKVNDPIPTFSRDLAWFKSEALYRLSRRWYAAARYSGINVDNALQGYQLRSFETDGVDLNFDVNELRRTSVGLGYRPNEATTFKLERTEDDHDLIPTPLRNTGAPVQRDFTTLQAVATF